MQEVETVPSFLCAVLPSETCCCQLGRCNIGSELLFASLLRLAKTVVLWRKEGTVHSCHGIGLHRR